MQQETAVQVSEIAEIVLAKEIEIYRLRQQVQALQKEVAALTPKPPAKKKDS